VTAAFNSLRLRFISSTFILIVVGLILTGVTVSTLMRLYIEQGFHEEMQIHIEELAALTSTDEQGQPKLLRRLSDPRFLVAKSGFYWEVRRKGFAPIKSPAIVSGDLSGSVATSPTKRWAVTDGPTGKSLEYGMIRVPAQGGPPLELSIGSDMRVLKETMHQFEWPLGWSLAIFAIVMLIAGAVQVAYGLRPLNRLANGVSRIRSGEAAAMAGNYPTEIQPLVSDLNALLESNAAMVRRARIQAGNLAHGLRTPLAIIIDEAEQLNSEGRFDSARALLGECDRMRRQINYHLARARTAATQPVPGQVAALSATIDPILRAMKRLHAERNLTLCCGPFPDVTIACDDVDLGEMLSNLIDNACKWAKTRVMVSWERTGDIIKIKVDDDGNGIATKDVEAAFSAGERLDDTTPGTGLGLAIVRDLATLYRGAIALETSPLGGLQAILTLPLAPVATGSSARN
jgi:signal transduction histidine kinase